MEWMWRGTEIPLGAASVEPVGPPRMGGGGVHHGHPGWTLVQGKRHLDQLRTRLRPWEWGTARALGRMLGTVLPRDHGR